MKSLKQVQIAKIKVDDIKNEQIVYLTEVEGSRYLPVVMGSAEINAIKIRLAKYEVPRPLTHDLLLELVNQLNGKILRVIIDNLENHTFFAKIILQTEAGEELAIDARPSDSIALALRAEAPIFVNEDVLEVAAI